MVSLLLLGYALPFVGRADDAEACLERALALCQSTGDELHLGAVYNNRSCLWIDNLRTTLFLGHPCARL